ncbi:MAG: ABC transporter permease [Bryobacteraceae bacterium]
MSASVAASATVLIGIHLMAAFANFIAPYEPQAQHREHPWAPPTRVRFHGFGLIATVETDGTQTTAYPLKFLHRGRLFAVDAPGKIFLFGTDALGRDQFSRLVYGSRVSLFSGVAAAAVSALLGLCFGGAAGFWGGFTDRIVMRIAELFLALPWMYLLLAARAFFPLNTDPRIVFVALLALLGAIGWARPARIVRGIVLSVKEREYVLASRGFGATPSYLLRRHILPEAYPAILTYLSLAIPQYILAEATLSFLGLGFSGEIPSWGSLIASLANLEVLQNYWWMSVPAAGLAAVFACYNHFFNALAGAESQKC